MTTSQGQTIFLKFGPSYSKRTWSPYLSNIDATDTKAIIGCDVIAGMNYLNLLGLRLIFAKAVHVGV